MTRAFGSIVLLASLAVVGLLVNRQLSGSGASSPTARIPVAQETEAKANLAQAAAALEQSHSATGTYVGASLANLNVTLVRADAASYCVQTSAGPQTFHESGPAGTAAPRGC